MRQKKQKDKAPGGLRALSSHVLPTHWFSFIANVLHGSSLGTLLNSLTAAANVSSSSSVSPSSRHCCEHAATCELHLAVRRVSTLAGTNAAVQWCFGPIDDISYCVPQTSRVPTHTNTHTATDTRANRDTVCQKANRTSPYRYRKPCYLAPLPGCSPSPFFLIFYTIPARCFAVLSADPQLLNSRAGVGQSNYFQLHSKLVTWPKSGQWAQSVVFDPAPFRCQSPASPTLPPPSCLWFACQVAAAVSVATKRDLTLAAWPVLQ